MRALVVLVAACSGAAPSGAIVAVPVLPDVPFALLDRDQKATFMKERVVPALAPLFRAHDPQRYADLACTTCHADDPARMPNPELPALQWPNRGRHAERDVAWMTETIAPAMARLLDEPRLDCTRCHVRATD